MLTVQYRYGRFTGGFGFPLLPIAFKSLTHLEEGSQFVGVESLTLLVVCLVILGFAHFFVSAVKILLVEEKSRILQSQLGT